MTEPHTGIVATRSETLDRWVQLGLASGRVINVEFPREPPADATEDHPLLDRIHGYLDEGASEDFADVEIALTVSTGDRRVYETLRDVDYGREISLDELVGATPLDTDDDDEQAETVLSALRRNPIPLVIPDHRVADAQGATPGDVRDTLRRLEGLPE